MAYERLNLKKDDLLDEAVFKRIDDAIEALDSALDAKVVEVEKMHYGTNRFDKNTIPFTQSFFVYSNASSNNGSVPFLCYTASTGGAGGGWLNIPVIPGKTYTMSVNNLVTLTDFKKASYGVFTNLWFTDAAGMIVSCVPANKKEVRSYHNNIDGSSEGDLHAQTAYNTEKIVCKAYGKGNNDYNGLYTNAITFTVIDETITHIQVQVGAESFGQFQTNTNFVARGFLTEDEVATLHNSFQINEGTELLAYEEFEDYAYIESETHSNLAKLEDLFNSAFVKKEIPSTNLLDPSYAYNHTFVRNLVSDGKIVIGAADLYALLKIPVSVGSYVLYSKLVPIGNATFGYFGVPSFLDEDTVVITSNYPFREGSGVGKNYGGYDTTKVSVLGENTNKITFEIYDENIKWMYVALCTKNSSEFGMWSNYSPSTGLTDEELYNLVYQMQLNEGKEVLTWKSFDDVKSVTLVTKDKIEGLDTFQTEMIEKLDEAVSKMSLSDKQMSCLIDNNEIYIRAKQFTTENDLVWHVRKERQQDNRYFNLENIYTCPTYINDEDMTSSLTQWKAAYDDIGPSKFNGTYIAGNHGYSCVARVTVASHDKTEADIGSTWRDSTGKIYVLVYVYDETSLGFIRYTDSAMASGKMSSGSPAAGTVITHISNATNTSDVIVERTASTQAWKSWNHYTLKMFVDGSEVDMNQNQLLVGNRIEITTEYNVIFIPAMLRYLMDNVGNNTSSSQNSDDITDYYVKIAINYQFNRNGSISEYNSYYINKDITLDYIGFVQSISLNRGSVYTYVPDTTYDVLTFHDGSETQQFSRDLWNYEDKAPYRYYQFTDATTSKGVCLTYDRSIGRGKNEKRLEQLEDAGMFFSSTKMYPSFISGGTLTSGTFFDGMAARIPLYKYDPDLTSVAWYWSNEDIILMIDAHQTVNKDIILPSYMKNLRIEKLDVTDSVNMEQTYLNNNKLRFQCTDYGYAVLRLYK